MLGPDSRVLTVLLVIASGALLAGAIRLRLLPVKVLCGALSITVAMVGGVAAVNFYYGYYTTWGQLWADVQGGSGNLGVISATSSQKLGSGRLGWITVAGRLSGYSRPALVYLPPQYGKGRYQALRFPVVELFHGSPGSPLAWDTLLHIGVVADTLLARHLIGPMLLVMPSTSPSRHVYQDCVNGPASYDDTYLTKDVRAYILARYRVSADPYQWGATGYSSGGYCAANLALRHRDSFGAAAVIEGYFMAADGPAANALQHSQQLEIANSPLYLAERLAPDGGPLPAFWVAGGTNSTDYRPAAMFVTALDRLQQVSFVKLKAGDSGNAWQAALPAALTWLWQQLAPPDLRVLFPTRSYTNSLGTLPVSPVKGHHPGPCKPGIQLGPAGLQCSPPLVHNGVKTAGL